MTVLRNSAGDPARNQQVIEALAKENSASVDHVRELFETEHAKLQAAARVKTFVSVIATRLVRNVLHAQRDTSQS
jgi:cell division inhibitor SulA